MPSYMPNAIYPLEQFECWVIQKLQDNIGNITYLQNNVLGMLDSQDKITLWDQNGTKAPTPEMLINRA